MTAIHLQLLGDFCLTYQGKPVANIDTPRLRALVAYLALHRHAPQARHHLAFTFWPDTSEAQALTNLRKQLLYLRNALPAVDLLVQVARQTVQWSPTAQFGLDVAEFEATLARATTAAGTQAINLLCHAIALYRGDLLPECYDEWILSVREALRVQYGNALTRLVQLLEAQRDYLTAIAYAQQLLRHDALHEPTYRTLMRLYTLNGDRATALRVYHTCVTQLREELGVEPDAETQATYERLLQQPVALEASHPVIATAPFVGRKAEWQMIQQAWRKAERGLCQFALIAGEAGIGKTRLAEELLDWAMHQGMATARTRSYAAEGRLAYAPVIELLRADALRPQFRQLDAAWLTELARLLPELLTEQPALSRPEPLTQGWQRRHLFEALARAVLAGDKPLVLLLDDLQWCDQETLEWLHFLLRFASNVDNQQRGRRQLLLIGTVRAEEVKADHPLTALLTHLQGGDQLTELDLAPLDAVETAELARSITTETLDASAAAQLYRNTEGNPLFVVETMRVGLSDQRPASRDQAAQPNLQSPVSSRQFLPPKIQAIIKARLAQLSPQARQVATLAAIIGREFTFDVLVAASQDNGPDVVDALDELWQRRIIREQGFQAYDFSHDRIREVAAAEVSVARRRLLHRDVAEALVTCYAGQFDAVATQIAAHYDVAGMAEQAITYYQQAAEVGLRVYANQAAISYLNRALALLRTLSSSRDRAEGEYHILIMLGPPLIAVQGYGSDKVGECCLAARRLAEQLNYPLDTAMLRILAIYHGARSEFALAHRYGVELLKIAQTEDQAKDPLLYAEGCYTLGISYFWQGHFLQARQQFEAGVASYDRQYHALHVARYGQDPGVICLSRLAWTLWYLGYAEQALQHSREAVALATLLNHPFSIGYALMFMQWLCIDARNDAALTELMNLALAYQKQFDFQPANRALEVVCRGKHLAVSGHIEEGIELIHKGIEMAALSQYDLMFKSHFHAILAQALLNAGNAVQACEAIDIALSHPATYDDNFNYYLAELHRVKGEILLVLGEPNEVVERCFVRSLEIARRQEAKSLELRAVMSLSRLWAQQDKQRAAHALLAEVYHWFTEGFDTPDLIDARALLAELG